MNADLFGGSPSLVKDEKSRSDFLAESLDAGSPSRDDISRLMITENMPKSLRSYVFSQTNRGTLAVSDADLIVMDNYADMNFKAWREKKLGWKLWVHPKYIRDEAFFHERFKPEGHLSLGESLEFHKKLINIYREKNGDIPVLYLNQPVAFYPKLKERAYFKKLGALLEKSLEGVFYGDAREDQLEPADVGSCGPGNTLHFTGFTYRKMLEMAFEKGLGDLMGRRVENPDVV